MDLIEYTINYTEEEFNNYISDWNNINGLYIKNNKMIKYHKYYNSKTISNIINKFSDIFLNINKIYNVNNNYYIEINRYDYTVSDMLFNNNNIKRDKIIDMIKNINKQIFYIEHIMIQRGGFYINLDYNNFVVSIENKKRKHFDKFFDNKLSDDLYYYIYISNFTSGLQIIKKEIDLQWALNFFVREYFINLKKLSFLIYSKNHKYVFQQFNITYDFINKTDYNKLELYIQKYKSIYRDTDKPIIDKYEEIKNAIINTL